MIARQAALRTVAGILAAAEVPLRQQAAALRKQAAVCVKNANGLADAAWCPTADPLMLRHLRTVAEDGDRQVLRTRQTADLLRELEQNQTHVDMLKRRNAWIAVELRARAEAEEESP